MRLQSGEAMPRPDACPKGHFYTDENTSRTGQGWRRCKRCERERVAARRAAQSIPKPIVKPDYQWTDEAACGSTEDDRFFTDNPHIAREMIRFYCDRCPVKFQCGQTAELNGEWYGIWGGQFRHPRKEMRWPANGCCRPSSSPRPR